MAPASAPLPIAPAPAPEPQPDSTDLGRVAAAAARFDRAANLDAGYSPWRHIALTCGIALAIAALGAALASRAAPVDWVFLPVFLVVANLLEWTVHRYPMHRPRAPRLLYKNHTLVHHVAFTDRNMDIQAARELGLIMMPWYTMLGLFVVASPVMVVAGLLRGPGLAGIFLLGAVGYFLTYEALHASYHLPAATLRRVGLGRLGLYRALQAHHAHHHVLRRMTHVNFNVTFPLMDRVFGTLERAEPGALATGGGAPK